MSKNTPRAPDPYKVSAAQTQSNKDTALFNAQLNRVNQSSPFGSVDWTHTGDDPASGWSQTTNLSPELQGLFDSQIGAQKGLSSAITGTLGNLPTEPFDPNIDVGDIRQRSFDSQMAMLQPKFNESWKNLETTMSDRGIPIGAEIWEGESNRFDTAREGAQRAAARTADLDASNEFQRQFGNELTKYNMPLQQLTGLMGNSSSVQNPTFSPFSQASAGQTDTAGNVWNAYNAEQQAAQNKNSQIGSGALGIGQLALAAFSDIRLKRDIKRIGALPSGLPFYEFEYTWGGGRQIGVMAQEALEMFPSAVSVHDSGYLMVRYDLIG